MGAVKSIPLVGETVTYFDATLKQTIAVATAPFSEETSQKFLQASMDTIVDYTERSPVAAAMLSLRDVISGNAGDAGKRWSKVGDSYLELLYGTPVVGYAKGVYHYAEGDTDKGDQCMKSASRSTAVIAATVPTAWAGAGPYVITTTAARYRPSGFIAARSREIETGYPVACTDAAGSFALEVATYAAAGYTGSIAEKQNTTRVYRVMENSEAYAAVSAQALSPGYQAGERPNGETWISESAQHSRQYLPQLQARLPGLQFETVEFNVDKGYYNTMKETNCIPQRGSSAVNTGDVVRNVINEERIAGTGRVNIGIKNANLDAFNDNVTRARTVDVNSWRYKNDFTEAVSHYGAETTGSVGGHLVDVEVSAWDDHED